MNKNKSPAKATPSPTFPIVGIGASAGGLEAIELFLKHVPASCGMAFVIVQHLDPTHKGIMDELLRRVTHMPVVLITDGVKVEPNQVYVIPANAELSILRGTLHLLPPVEPRGLRLPIDTFFNSLADDQQANSIGVILSGMGSDGSKGLRAIKNKGGRVFVQTPESAKFDGMPRSAIETGLADVIAPPEQLADKIISDIATPKTNALPHPEEDASIYLLDKDQSNLEKINVILRAQTGHDFSLYKKSTIYRRIERRMAQHQLSKIADYVRYLRENPPESTLLFKELLISVTSFFRDPAVWEQLKQEVIPALLSSHPNGGALRAWSAGCATGEEAYTLAMTFREVMDEIKPEVHYSLQIFATDLDKQAIDKARAGIFSKDIEADVSEARLRRFFVPDEGGGYRVCKEIREKVIFAPQNLVMDPPFTKMDLVICRNLLIYLEPDLQKKVMPLFHYSLNPAGILVLGTAETIGTATDMFVPLPGKTRIFKRIESGLRPNRLAFPALMTRPRPETTGAVSVDKTLTSPTLNLENLTDHLLLQHYCPAALLTDDKGDITYIRGKTGKYLEPSAGKASLNVFTMARDGLSGSLHAAFTRAVRQQTPVTIKAVKVETNAGHELLDVSVMPLNKVAGLNGMVLIVFTPSPEPGTDVAQLSDKQHADNLDTKLSDMALELQQAHEDLQATREEMQASQEELKATNEELQSTNEELQSTNEELTTSKEEMQSMNEELQTVNHELQAKVDELSRAGDDMKNLLNSSDIATLFLDGELKVRRFTSQTTSIIKLIPGDVGRPITDLVTELDYPHLAEDAREVLRTLIGQQHEATAKGGRWFSVRIRPYRTQDNRIDGVVITFVDIAQAKALESTLREAMDVLTGRLSDQSAELDAAKSLEAVLRKAQDVLEKRLQDQALSLTKSKSTQPEHPDNAAGQKENKT